MVRAMVRSLWLVAFAACAAPSPPAPAAPQQPQQAQQQHRSVTLTIVGTNDLHGALVRLPLLAGYVANVRAERAADGGGVLLVDAGDLFQGTLESNLGEGVDVVRAYDQLGYAAAAIGNHEFDYGPVGPAVTVSSPGEDPRGALKARIAAAHFPFLVTNIADAATGERIAWPNTAPGTIVDVAGVHVGIVGASTEATPTTTMPANFVGLAMLPAAPAIEAEAKRLRGLGAQVIVVVAHMGSTCKHYDQPDDTTSCDRGDELFRVIHALPPGAVDVFVAGHTHAIVAHRIDGVAAIESLSSGRAFGRVDLRVEDGRIANVAIHQPQLVCPLDGHGNAVAVADCHPEPYDGKPVVADARVQQIVDDALTRAGERRKEKLGVTLAAVVTKSYRTESAEGDLMTDLMLAAVPNADVAMTNGGGLRADIPAGELTYGGLFEAVPFDNRFAIVTVTGKQLRRLVESNLRRDSGILSWSGLTAKASCKGHKLDLAIAVRGKPLDGEARYTIVTSDFLASGGDGLFGHLGLPDGAIRATDTIIRDAIADVLRARKGSTIDPGKLPRRLDYPGARPVKCGEAEEDEP
jgi:5'-nucleotidase